MSNNPFMPEHKRTIIKINDQSYSIIVFYSMNDMMLLTKYINNEKKDSRRIIAKMIYEKIDIEESERPSVDIIAAQDTTIFETYINTLVDEDIELKTYYDKFQEEKDVCFRLILAARDQYKNYLKAKMSSKNIMAQLVAAQEMCSHFDYSFLSRLSKAAMPSSALTAYAASLQNNKALNFTLDLANRNAFIANLGAAASAAAQYQDVVNAITKNMLPLNNWINDISTQLGRFVSEIQIPNISEERKAELIDSHKKWGEYGWSIIPKSLIKMYTKAPENQKSADEVALIYCQNKDMEDLFIKLRELKNIKKTDLEEAICNFEQKRYKSCAMIIFSLLDAKLIRLQRNKDRDPRTKRRPTGKTALNNLFTRLKEEQDIENTFFLCLSYENLFSCLQKVFEDGNDFKKQPSIINRNFIDHGMLIKKVTRKDCIQLFLLYYNFIDFYLSE